MADKTITYKLNFNGEELQKEFLNLGIEMLRTKEKISKLNKEQKELNNTFNNAKTQKNKQALMEVSRAHTELTQKLKQQKIEYNELSKIELQNVSINKKNQNTLKATRAQLAANKIAISNLNKASKTYSSDLRKLQGQNAGLNREIKAVTSSLKIQTKTLDKNTLAQKKTAGAINQTTAAQQKQRSAFGKAVSYVKNYVVAYLGFYAIVNLFKNMASVTNEYEQALADTAAVMGRSITQMNNLSKAALLLGKTTRYTAVEIMKLTESLARLGFSEKQILTLTPSVLNLATALKANLAESGELAGAVMRSFQLDMQDSKRVMDVLAKSTTISALNFEKLKIAMPKVAAVAKTMGESVEETAAKLAVLSNNGIEATIMGTSLRNIHLRLTKAGYSWAEGMDAIASASDKAAFASELLGDRASTAGIILSENTDKIAEYNAELKNSDGITQQLSETRLDTMEGKLLLLKSAWQGNVLAANEASGVMSFFGGIISFITKYMKALLITMYILIQTFVVFKLVAWMATLSINGMSSALTRLWLVLLANPFAAIIAGITAAIIVIYLFISATTEAEDSIKNINKSLSQEEASLSSIIHKLIILNRESKDFKDTLDLLNTKYKDYLDTKIKDNITTKELLELQKKLNKAKKDEIVLAEIAAKREKIDAKLREDKRENLQDYLDSWGGSKTPEAVGAIAEELERMKEAGDGSYELMFENGGLGYFTDMIHEMEGFTELTDISQAAIVKLFNTFKEQDDLIKESADNLKDYEESMIAAGYGAQIAQSQFVILDDTLQSNADKMHYYKALMYDFSKMSLDELVIEIEKIEKEIQKLTDKELRWNFDINDSELNEMKRKLNALKDQKFLIEVVFDMKMLKNNMDIYTALLQQRFLYINSYQKQYQDDEMEVAQKINKNQRFYDYLKYKQTMIGLEDTYDKELLLIDDKHALEKEMLEYDDKYKSASVHEHYKKISEEEKRLQKLKKTDLKTYGDEEKKNLLEYIDEHTEAYNKISKLREDSKREDNIQSNKPDGEFDLTKLKQINKEILSEENKLADKRKAYADERLRNGYDNVKKEKDIYLRGTKAGLLAASTLTKANTESTLKFKQTEILAHQKITENIRTEQIKRMDSYIVYNRKLLSLSDMTDAEINDVIKKQHNHNLVALEHLLKMKKITIAEYNLDVIEENSKYNELINGNYENTLKQVKETLETQKNMEIDNIKELEEAKKKQYVQTKKESNAYKTAGGLSVTEKKSIINFKEDQIKLDEKLLKLKEENEELKNQTPTIENTKKIIDNSVEIDAIKLLKDETTKTYNSNKIKLDEYYTYVDGVTDVQVKSTIKQAEYKNDSIIQNEKDANDKIIKTKAIYADRTKTIDDATIQHNLDMVQEAADKKEQMLKVDYELLKENYDKDNILLDTRIEYEDDVSERQYHLKKEQMQNDQEMKVATMTQSNEWVKMSTQEQDEWIEKEFQNHNDRLSEMEWEHYAEKRAVIFQMAQLTIDSAMEVSNAIMEITDRRLDAELERITARNREETRQAEQKYKLIALYLTAQLKHGEITERQYAMKKYRAEEKKQKEEDARKKEQLRLENQIAKEKFENAKTYQIAQIQMNAASAIIGTWAGYSPFAYVGAASAIAQTAFIAGAAVLKSAVVADQEFTPKTSLGKGGLLKGDSHSDPSGGITLNNREIAEGGEFVVNKETTARNIDFLQDFNEGKVSPNQTINNSIDYDRLADLINDKKVILTQQDLVEDEDDRVFIENITTF